MNEQERAQNYTRDVDALLRGETPPAADADDRALLDLARDLLAADFSAETRLDLLRPKLAKPTLKGLIMSPRYRYVRWFVTTAALFTLIVAIVLTVPPLRAIAQDILRQIGIMTVTDAPTDYEVSQRPIVAVDLVHLIDDGDWHPITAEEIVSEYLWLAMIEGMPTGFDTVEYGFATPPGEQRIAIRLAKYTQSEDAAKEISLGQIDRVFSNGPVDFETGGAITEEIAINGEAAVWVSAFTEYPDLDVQILIWEEKVYDQIRNDLMIVLKGRGLTKEEMLEIAHSVTIRDPNRIISRSDNTDWSSDTPRQVAAKVGFDVAIIREHPENFRLIGRHVFDSPRATQIVTSYAFGSQDLSFQQIKVNDASLVENGGWEFNVGDSPVEDVTVNGNPGVWIEGVTGYANTVRDSLIWEQDGFSYHLQGKSVSRQDMFAAAESLKYIGSPD